MDTLHCSSCGARVQLAFMVPYPDGFPGEYLCIDCADNYDEFEGSGLAEYMPVEYDEFIALKDVLGKYTLQDTFETILRMDINDVISILDSIPEVD